MTDEYSEATDGIGGPHDSQPVVTAGAEPETADAVAVLLHGRGASARGILGLAEEFETERVRYVAPQAAGRTWYPRSFLEEIDANEPHLSSALALVGRVVDRTASTVGRDRIVLLGFSQGACLASEWIARNTARYGGLVALSGGLIGPEGTPREYEGSLDGTPVFLGCSDVDPHIPLKRVHETRDVLDELGADVDERIYEGMGHGINEDELTAARELVGRVMG